MDLFLNFLNPLHIEAHSSHLKSNWSAWSLRLKCTIFFLALSSIFSLVLSTQVDGDPLSSSYRVQAICNFSLTLLATAFLFCCKHRITSHFSRSFLTTIITLFHIVASHEVNFVYCKDLAFEEGWNTNFTLIFYKIIPVLLLIFLCYTWIFKALIIVCTLCYIMFRITPSSLLVYNGVYMGFAVVAIIYLFYTEEKTNKIEFMSTYSIQTKAQLTKKFFDSFPEGHMILDKDNTPLCVNHSMKRTLRLEGSDEEAIKQKINDLKIDYIVSEINKYYEGNSNDVNFLNSSPPKLFTPLIESPDKSRNNLDHTRNNFERFLTVNGKITVAKPKMSKSGLTIPSMYLDDLKFKRKASKKSSFKESLEDLKLHFKENSLLLDCPSPNNGQLNKSKSAAFNTWPVENVFKLKIESERFKGYVTNAIKNGDHITFNLYEEKTPIRRNHALFIETEPLAFQIKYQEVLIDQDKYKFLTITDQSGREKIANMEESSKFKNLMFASISHEFRTPVNGILALLEGAIKKLESKKIVKTHIRPALHSAHMLMYLINDMLDYSQILVDEFYLTLDIFSVKDCLEEVTNLIEDQTQIKDLDLRVTIKRDTPSHIKSDKRRVQQVLVNLLTNAIKFTIQGTIEVIAERFNNSSNFLKISVKDTGIGLNSCDRERLRITMNDGHINGKISHASVGAGLGLMMAQSLALALGPCDEIAPGVAGINVESHYGEGSTFHFVVYNQEILGTLDEIPTIETLPQERSPNGRKSTIITALYDPKVGMSHANFASAANFSLGQMRLSSSMNRNEVRPCCCSKILIVDDTSYNIFVLRNMLNSFNFQSDSAYDGQDACKVVSQEHIKRQSCCEGYKLIFMDCNMPIMDGFEATKALTGKMKAKEIKAIPIIGWTAYTDKGSFEQGISSGMSEIITKPVTTKTLEGILKKYGLIDGNKTK